MLSNEKLLHDHPANQVLQDDLFEDIGCAGMVPRAFGIYHRDEAANAYLEAVRLCSIDTA